MLLQQRHIRVTSAPKNQLFTGKTDIFQMGSHMEGQNPKVYNQQYSEKQADKMLPFRQFRFMEKTVDKRGSLKYVDFTPPRIVKGKRWYIAYRYRVPPSLREKYKRDFERFRVYEDINRYKTDEYAKLLRDQVEQALLDGYTPFPEATVVNTGDWSLSYGLDQFIEYTKGKGLRAGSVEQYIKASNLVREYFLTDNSIYRPVKEVTREQIKAMMSFFKTKNKWANTTYNNNITILKLIFNWFMKEEKILKNPVQVERLMVSIEKNKYYDQKTAALLKETMLQDDPYLYKFISFIYYTAVRPKKEVRALQVKHVLFDRGLLSVPSTVSKNKKTEFIPMATELVNLLKSMGVDQSPPEYYIFGRGKPEERPVGFNYFAAKYRKIKKKLGIGNDWTIFSWRHTRAIDLANAGANPYDIMKIFRHSNLEITMRYLRELGLNISEGINEKTKKF